MKYFTSDGVSEPKFSSRAGLLAGVLDRPLVLLAAFCLPLKLSFAYIALIPLIALMIAQNFGRIHQRLRSSIPTAILIPYLFWLYLAFISSFFGINIGNSLLHLGSLAYISLLAAAAVVYLSRNPTRPLLLALLSGQALAALHSVIETQLPSVLQDVPIGSLSESGQLALTIPLAFGLLLSERKKKFSSALDLLAGVVVFSSALLFGLNKVSWGIFCPIILITGTVLLLQSFSWRKNQGANDSPLYFAYFARFILPILLAALLLNLKRGPWFGVSAALIIMLASFRPKLVLPFLLLIVGLFLSIAPLRERLLDAQNHFFISGGRSEMWTLGAEIIAKHPLGIGFENSSLMKRLDPNISPSHRHFHSNPVNILVETGWLGLALFIWWIFSMLRTGFSDDSSEPAKLFLKRTIACSLLSWQIAGLFEYNFGDSEVVLVAILLIGVLSALKTRSCSANLVHALD